MRRSRQSQSTNVTPVGDVVSNEGEGGERSPPTTDRRSTVPVIEIYGARIDPANVDRLMESRAAAVAEFQEQVPELLQADLVRTSFRHHRAEKLTTPHSTWPTRKGRNVGCMASLACI
jgi:hypothetical protein